MDFKEAYENGFMDVYSAEFQYKKLYEEHQKLLDDIYLHPDYEDTFQSTIETAQKEIKEENKKLKDKLKMWYTMMTACDKANDFAFGCGDEECNPDGLDDMDHLPAHIKKLNDENKKLKEENQKLREVKNKRTEKMGKIIYDIKKKLEELNFEVSLGDLLERAD